jgi:Trk K+ transport system NAD-binding subunit
VKKEMTAIRDGKEVTEHHIAGVPDSKQVLEATDRLLIFGHNRDIDRFLEINA